LSCSTSIWEGFGPRRGAVYRRSPDGPARLRRPWLLSAGPSLPGAGCQCGPGCACAGVKPQSGAPPDELIRAALGVDSVPVMLRMARLRYLARVARAAPPMLHALIRHIVGGSWRRQVMADLGVMKQLLADKLDGVETPRGADRDLQPCIEFAVANAEGTGPRGLLPRGPQGGAAHRTRPGPMLWTCLCPGPHRRPADDPAADGGRCRPA